MQKHTETMEIFFLIILVLHMCGISNRLSDKLYDLAVRVNKYE